MSLIIGQGSEDDERSLRLYTKANNFIRNERRREQHPDQLKAALKLREAEFSSIELRSISATYNCMGMVFACRRTSVDPAELSLILRDDNYAQTELSSAMPGDLVVYRSVDGHAKHVGTIVEVEPRIMAGPTERSHRLKVLSKWGFEGEYLHDLQDVPETYGNRVEIWTERRTL